MQKKIAYRSWDLVPSSQRPISYRKKKHCQFDIRYPIRYYETYCVQDEYFPYIDLTLDAISPNDVVECFHNYIVLCRNNSSFYSDVKALVSVNKKLHQTYRNIANNIVDSYIKSNRSVQDHKQLYNLEYFDLNVRKRLVFAERDLNLKYQSLHWRMNPK